MDLNVTLLLDTSRSIDWGHPNKGLYVKRVAAALAYIGLVNYDRVSVYAYSDSLTQELRAVRGRRLVSQVIRSLEDVPLVGPSNFAAVAKRFAVRFTCRREVEFGISPEDAEVAIDGKTIGVADDWDGMGGGKAWKFPGPGFYVALFTLKGFETVEVLLIADPKAKDDVCEVDTELKEKE